MHAEIVFEIYFGIAKWHAVLLERGALGPVVDGLRVRLAGLVDAAVEVLEVRLRDGEGTVSASSPLTLRAVATRLSPDARTDSARARPIPRELPVINQVLAINDSPKFAKGKPRCRIRLTVRCRRRSRIRCP